MASEIWNGRHPEDGSELEVQVGSTGLVLRKPSAIAPAMLSTAVVFSALAVVRTKHENRALVAELARRLRADEASEALDRYLNDAYLAGNQVARIVHGKGLRSEGAPVLKMLVDRVLRQRGDVLPNVVPLAEHPGWVYPREHLLLELPLFPERSDLPFESDAATNTPPDESGAAPDPRLAPLAALAAVCRCPQQSSTISPC